MPGARIDWHAEDTLARQRASVLRRQKPAEVTIEVWLSSYHLLFPDERDERTRHSETSLLRGLRKAHGKRKMMEFTPMQAQAWALKHPGHVRYLKRAWRKAVLMQIAPWNVWSVVEMPKRKKEAVRPPTQHEYEGILARCSELARDDPWFLRFADMIEVAAYSGARVGGLMGLERPDVDLDRRRMVVTEKGSKTRTMVLCGDAWPAMTRTLQRRWPWCECRLSPLSFDRGWQLCAHCRLPPREPRLPFEVRKLVFRWKDGTPLRHDRVGGSWAEVRGDFKHGFHSLKHFAATWLASEGVDPLDIATQLGHTDREGRPYERLVKRVYDHPDPELALERIVATVDPRSRVPLESEART